jgi:hypothetical protein
MQSGEDDNVRTDYERLAVLREQLAAMGKAFRDAEYASILMGSLPPPYKSVQALGLDIVLRVYAAGSHHV